MGLNVSNSELTNFVPPIWHTICLSVQVRNNNYVEIINSYRNKLQMKNNIQKVYRNVWTHWNVNNYHDNNTNDNHHLLTDSILSPYNTYLIFTVTQRDRYCNLHLGQWKKLRVWKFMRRSQNLNSDFLIFTITKHLFSYWISMKHLSLLEWKYCHRKYTTSQQLLFQCILL